MQTSTTLDPQTERAARAFLDQVRRHWIVLAAVLYGSRARGNATDESDADMAVVLGAMPDDRLAEAIKMADIAFDVMLETGVLVEALPLLEREWNHPESFNNPALIENIRRDGIAL